MTGLHLDVFLNTSIYIVLQYAQLGARLIDVRDVLGVSVFLRTILKSNAIVEWEA